MLIKRIKQLLVGEHAFLLKVFVCESAHITLLTFLYLKTSGHLEVSKTESKVRQKFYWPRLQADVRSNVAGLETCSKQKRLIPKRRAPMQIVSSGCPIERIATDIIGPLPQTEKGNKYIVVVADYLNEWTEALPMSNVEVCTVAKLLVE